MSERPHRKRRRRARPDPLGGEDPLAALERARQIGAVHADDYNRLRHVTLTVDAAQRGRTTRPRTSFDSTQAAMAFIGEVLCPLLVLEAPPGSAIISDALRLQSWIQGATESSIQEFHTRLAQLPTAPGHA